MVPGAGVVESMFCSRPHKLDLYRLAVQHPQAEVNFLLRCYQHYRGTDATKLKEDFAGTAALAAQWVVMHDNMRALAVEAHGPTVRYAQRQLSARIPGRTSDLHLIQADVLQVARPRVDIVAALNFSTFIYHDRDHLRQYFCSARRSLTHAGLLVIDAYGGPGAIEVGCQKRTIRPPASAHINPFTYIWQQKRVDVIAARVDCCIHFVLHEGARERKMRNCFHYGWRLWTLPELTELLLETGFTQAQVWCDYFDSSTRQSDGRYCPLSTMPPRRDWVAYIVGVK